jgi:hypothetical protein
VKVLIARQTRRSTSFGVNSWRVSDRQSHRVKSVARRWCESALVWDLSIIYFISFR